MRQGPVHFLLEALLLLHRTEVAKKKTDGDVRLVHKVLCLVLCFVFEQQVLLLEKDPHASGNPLRQQLRVRGEAKQIKQQACCLCQPRTVGGSVPTVAYWPGPVTATSPSSS